MTEEKAKKEIEDLKKEATEYAIEYANRFWGKKESLDRACTIDNFKDGYLAGAEPREKRIEELDKENGKLEGKLADLQSEYVELENFKNNEVNELKELLTKAKKILQDMLSDIPNRMWYTDDTIKEAEQFLKEEENDG